MLESFTVPSSGDIAEALHKYGEFGIAHSVALHIGTASEVQKRTQCPSCRLVAMGLAKSSMLATMIGAEDIFITSTWRQGVLRMCKASPYSQSEYDKWIFAPGSLLIYSDRYAPGSYGRLIKDVPVDLSKIRRWLELCDTRHGPDCKPSTSSDVAFSKNTLRLIDVIEMKIVQRPWSTNYLALSYVWGGVQQLCLLKSNRAALQKPGALSKEIHQISRTVRESMKFTRLIGERYLWVDCLCLTNDDQEELNQGMYSMFQVYQGAYFTIVAANGSSADASLPRLSTESRHPEQAFEHIKPGLSMIVAAYLDQCLPNTAWYTRGWT
jgi:hypothetical protein